jgi:putative flippase GtrA
MRFLDQTFKFIFIGVLSNLVSYVFFLIMLKIMKINYLLSLSVLFIVALFINFIFNKNWTFESDLPYKTSLIKFLIVYIIGYLLNIASMFFLVDKLGNSPEIVQAGMIGFLAFYYFLLNKYYIYNNNNKKS